MCEVRQYVGEFLVRSQTNKNISTYGGKSVGAYLSIHVFIFFDSRSRIYSTVKMWKFGIDAHVKVLIQLIPIVKAHNKRKQ